MAENTCVVVHTGPTDDHRRQLPQAKHGEALAIAGQAA